MQRCLLPFSLVSPLAVNGDLSQGSFEVSRALFLGSLLFFQGDGGMDISKVGEKILSSVRSARSLGILPSSSDRPEVPARAAAAAAIARALAGLPPHQRYNLSSSSDELSSIYGSRPRGQVVEELEEEFYEELCKDFDPVKHILEHIPSEENEVAYFEGKATLRLAQLDTIAERLSRHVMEHHEEMVEGMHLVRELERDLKIANVICMNGRRHLTSSRNEVSRDLIVTTNSKRKQALLDMLPILNELRHALDMQVALESNVEEGKLFTAFRVLSEYLQLLDSFSELSAIQEMSRGVEVWLGKTLQKLDSLLLGVCQDFKEEAYITLRRIEGDALEHERQELRPTIFRQDARGEFGDGIAELLDDPLGLLTLDAVSSNDPHESDLQVVDAYALIGDVSGLAEKVQSFFMQEVLSETHAALKNILQEKKKMKKKKKKSYRFTYSDLCNRIPESKFGQCLLATLAVLFKLMCSYYSILSFQPELKGSACHTAPVKQKEDENSGQSDDVQDVDPVSMKSHTTQANEVLPSETVDRLSILTSTEEPITTALPLSGANGSTYVDCYDSEARDGGSEASSSESPWFQLRKDATSCASQTLQRGSKNLWQLTTSRVSVLLSSPAVCSTSIHQFLKNYEDLNIFILAGEAFCGVKAAEFRHKVKAICENYFAAFHRQNIYALKMVMEKETWLPMPPDTIQVVSFAGLVGDGAGPIIPSDNSSNARASRPIELADSVENGSKKSGFSHWIKNGNPFLLKLSRTSKDYHDSIHNGSAVSDECDGKISKNPRNNQYSPQKSDTNHVNGINSLLEDENEDLHADFIDEDSQLPSRISKPKHSTAPSSHWNDEEMRAQTGSSLCLLRLMDKYARLMLKLEIINVEFFKGICQLFGIFFHFLFESFSQPNSYPNGKGLSDPLTCKYWLVLSLKERK
ncbi:hypothetical protein RJ639_013020 [Escallonia herrerae]|uniref:Vacuolar protein sorting-associated protein 54 N-terminal domain-containing protein n=1 Tax=Escallonia herrerae TaxID=1293975 RepID=A0AA89AQI8_9ASTE|nr:hypothetical protein RJ639_013020 [Escallonia herrerae]